MILGKKLPKNNCYLSNSKLKKENVQIDFDQDQIDEYIKCKTDIVYFCKNYVKIVHVDRGLIPFDMYDFQEDLVKHIDDNRFTATLCSRQVGKSITTVSWILHYILFNDYKRVGIIANKGSSARKVLGKLKLAYENLPHWIQQGVVEWNKGSIELDNGCTVEASSTAGDAARGDSLSVLFVDECAFIEPNLWEDFYSSTYSTISSGETTKIILISTAHGMNHYYKIYTDSKNKKSSFKHFEVDWRVVPGRDEKWKAETISNTSKEQFSQEHENTFLGGTKTLISNSVLLTIPISDPMMDLEKNHLKIYEKPIKGHTYVLSSDVSEGIGLDYQAFNIIDVTSYPFKQVAVFRDNKTSYTVYPKIIYKYATAYNNAYVLIESNDVGKNVVGDLNYDLEYDNIVTLKTNKEKYTLGMRTTKVTKAVGCSNLKDLVDMKQLIINDFDTIWELSGFVESGKTYEADVGFTDDIVMSLVNFAYFTTKDMFADVSEHNVADKLFADYDISANEDLMPMPMIEDGLSEFEHEEVVHW